jgi:hypothetical protein
LKKPLESGDGVEEKDKLVEVVMEFVNHVNEVNKRCIVAIVVCVSVMCLLMGFVSFVYFTTDYYYPNVISNIDSDSNTNTNGGETNG